MTARSMAVVYIHSLVMQEKYGLPSYYLIHFVDVVITM